jgi:hypothetical protein
VTDQRLRQCWQAVAERHGGSLRSPPGFRGFLLRGEAITLEVLVDGHPVQARVAADGPTTVTSWARSAGSLTIRIGRRRAFSSWTARLHGLRPLWLADPAFDAAFAVASNDEPRARAWLDGEVRRHLADAVAYAAVIEDGTVLLRAGGREHVAARLDAALRAAAALGRRTISGGPYR